MSGITTHVLDTSRGGPAEGVEVALERRSDDAWIAVGRGRTGTDGRVQTLTGANAVVPGTYRLFFDTRQYFSRLGTPAFYPQVTVVFEVLQSNEHYHVPLLLSPYGYSTYRGS